MTACTRFLNGNHVPVCPTGEEDHITDGHKAGRQQIVLPAVFASTLANYALDELSNHQYPRDHNEPEVCKNIVTNVCSVITVPRREADNQSKC